MAISLSSVSNQLALTNSSIGIDPSSGSINVSGSPGTISSGDSVVQSLEKLDTAIQNLNSVDAGLSMNKADKSGSDFYGPIGIQASFISSTKWTFSVNASNQLIFNYNGTDVATVNTDGTSSFGGSTAVVLQTTGTFDMSAGTNFKCTPAGAITIGFSNLVNGQSGSIYFDNSGGHGVTQGTNVKISANDLSAINGNAGIYWLAYFTDGTDVLVASSGSLT